MGTTSACAENTKQLRYFDKYFGNYLRVRGEYVRSMPGMGWTRELPPRARRIHRATSFRCLIGGTTSACAENT